MPETTTWRPFTYAGRTYNLAHLTSATITYEVPAEGSMPARTYVVDVIYSPHCFTSGRPRTGSYDRSLEYRDGREVRLFDEERWHLSHRLPAIIQSLLHRPCRFGAGHMQNYFTVEIITADGAHKNYNVFFTVTKSSKKGRLNLFVQSAYLNARLPGTRSIRFKVILAKAAHSGEPRP